MSTSMRFLGLLSTMYVIVNVLLIYPNCVGTVTHGMKVHSLTLTNHSANNITFH